jgi:putative serine protease PepD
VAEPQPPGEVANPHSGKAPGGGYGPDFGSIPDFTELPNGVRFADVRPGSPAAKAGLKAGDILTQFDGKPIQNLYDFTYALRASHPGQEVLVKVLRGTESIEAKVLLTERK